MTKESRVPVSKLPLSPSGATSRIASSLAQWRLDAPSSKEDLLPPQDGAKRPNLQKAIEAAIRARALRPDYVPSELLQDPAWDMLLELFRAEVSGEQATASLLSKAAGVSTGSGLRWIDALVAKGLCLKGNRGDDGRMLVKLSSSGSEALRAYFANIVRPSTRPPRR